MPGWIGAFWRSAAPMPRLLAALRLADWDAAVSAPSDPRSFHTLLTAPALELVSGHYAQVWLLDGELFPGEGALCSSVCRRPSCTFFLAAGAGGTGGDHRPGGLKCPGAVPVIRRTLCRSVAEAAGQSGLTPVQVRTAFTAFGELSLVRWTESPFFYELLPPVPCRLDASPTLRTLRRWRRHSRSRNLKRRKPD